MWTQHARAGLLVGASLVVCLLAPARAADECGVTGVGGTVVCTPAGNPYAAGIFYTTPGVTVEVQPGVSINTSVQDGVAIESTGSLTITTTGAVTVNSTGVNRDGLRADTQSGGSVVVNSTANITVTSDTGDGIIARSNLGAVGNGLGNGTVFVSSSGIIEIFGNTATGISAAGSGLFTDVTVSGSITTHGIVSSPAVFIANGSVNPAAFARATLMNAAILTAGANSPGIGMTTFAGRAIVAGSGSIQTTGDSSQGVGAATLFGGSTEINWNGIITTTGTASAGIQTQNTTVGTATIIASGIISTTGNNSAGINALSADGTINIAAYASIATSGDGAQGILANSTGPNGSVRVTSFGPIVTAGLESHGVVANAVGAALADVRSSVTAQGQYAVGISVTSSLATADIIIAPGASIMGGWQPDTASTGPTSLLRAGGIVIGGNGPARTPASIVTNQGSIGAWSDRAITTADLYGLTAPNAGVLVENFGTVTGFVEFGAGTNTFNNYSANSFNIRNFADTNGDLIRDTERVAISQFGGGVFNNTATGTVRLATVPNTTLGTIAVDPLAPTAWDPAGIFLPSGVDVSVHDISLAGVEQGQLLGLSRFVNSGIITMMDAETGGTGPVAGDVLVIGGGSTAGVYGGGVFESAGGQLRLDTVLNEGSVAASRSDVLVVDGTVVTSGPTRIFITNAGGSGAQTVGDGIKIVDVLDPASSAPGTFVLDQRVGAGAWEYFLFHGGVADPADGDWYLRNTLRAEVALYQTVPLLVQEIGFWMLGTYHERQGDPLTKARTMLSIKDETCGSDERATMVTCAPPLLRYAWARVMAGRGELSTPGAASSEYDRQGLQAGHDLLQIHNANGTHDTAGVYVGAGRLAADARTSIATIGSSQLDAYALGVYWTRRSTLGWYVDAVGQAAWSQAKAVSTQGETISTDAIALAVSLEVGHGWRIGQGMVLEPQAQLIYQRIGLDRASDGMGQVSFSASDQIRGRLGLRVAKAWPYAGLQSTVWGRVNIWHDFLTGPSSTFAGPSGANGLTFMIEDRGTLGEFQAGLTTQLSRSVSLYGQGSWGVSLDRGGSNDIGAQAGLKITW